jgi:hypothetical protein
VEAKMLFDETFRIHNPAAPRAFAGGDNLKTSDSMAHKAWVLTGATGAMNT